MKRGVGLRRKKPLKAKKPMKRSKITLADVKSVWKKLIAPVNKARAAVRRLDQFGPAGFSEFVRKSGCVVARASRTDEGCLGPVQHCHLKSRGSGGIWKDNSFGCCVAHHAEQHNVGIETFQKRHGLDLDLECCAISHAWERSEYGW